MRELKKRGWSAPALLVTAFPSTDLSRQALDLGFAEVVAKPFLDRSIVGIVKGLLPA
jgi:hypothetical protein